MPYYLSFMLFGVRVKIFYLEWAERLIEKRVSKEGLPACYEDFLLVSRYRDFYSDEH